jgi:hypothetical protein
VEQAVGDLKTLEKSCSIRISSSYWVSLIHRMICHDGESKIQYTIYSFQKVFSSWVLGWNVHPSTKVEGSYQWPWTLSPPNGRAWCPQLCWTCN